MGISERKDRERLEMRGLILETAMKLFITEGIEKVTLRRIAEQIEYSPSTIYLYFKDKDEMLYALHCEGFEELFKRQQTIMDIEDPIKRLRRHAEIYLTFALERPEHYDLMFIMKAPVNKLKETLEWEVGLRSYEFLKENIRECMDSGLMQKTDYDAATFALWALVHGIASLLIRQRCIMFPEEHMGSLIGASLDFILNGLVGKPGGV